MTRVYFSLDGFLDAGTRLEAADVIMEFEGFEKGDKTRCISVKDANTRDAQGVGAEIPYLDDKWEEAFKEHVDTHSNMYHYPLYQIRIKHHILDTKLPGLKWDWENRAMSFNWHGMLSSFYRETAELSKRVGGWVAKHNDALRTAVRADNGDFALTDTVSLGVWAKRLSRATRSHRVKIRRERLLRQYGGRSKGDDQRDLAQWEKFVQSRIESRRQEAERLDFEEEPEAEFDDAEVAYFSDEDCIGHYERKYPKSEFYD